MEKQEQFSPNAPITPAPASKNSLPKALILGACLVLLAGGAVLGYWLKGAPTGVVSNSKDISSQTAFGDVAGQTPISTADSYPTPPPETCATYTPTTRQLSGLIAWTEAQETAPLDIFSPNPDNSSYVEQNSKFYRVGRVQSGSYKDYEVVLGDIAAEGPAFYPNYYRFFRQGNKVVMLGKYSPEPNEWDGLDHSKITADNSYYVADLDYPKTFQGATNRQNFERDLYATFKFCADELIKVFHHAILGDVYTSPLQAPAESPGLSRNQYSQGFYLPAPDGTTKVYKLVVDFQGVDNIPAVTWRDGSKNTSEYTFTDIGGCGSQNYLSVMSPDKVDPAVDLAEAGVNSFGDKIYTLQNPDHLLLKDIYENQYYVYQGEKISYGEFFENRPVFFWYNPFGRLAKFQNNKFVPMAECAKPVIYLYPEKSQEISVQLSPFGGFSHAEPAYDGGWNVVASPAGELINQADGKAYPYLFWEGRGGLYVSSHKGFVVARAEVHAFLLEKLSKLGLNAKESGDFMEFWEPRMRAAPYYFVTFYGNSVMDYLAPLSITPAPDSVIRVLMDFTPLDQPIVAEGYKIKTPIRRGFTVVEWGGVLRNQ